MGLGYAHAHNRGNKVPTAICDETPLDRNTAPPDIGAPETPPPPSLASAAGEPACERHTPEEPREREFDGKCERENGDEGRCRDTSEQVHVASAEKSELFDGVAGEIRVITVVVESRIHVDVTGVRGRK